VTLKLVGTPIGNLGDLSPRAVEVLRAASVIACEDTRRTRALLSACGIPAGRRLRAVHAHNETDQSSRIVAEVAAGRVVAYVTDAGLPGISDPGAELVRACIRAGFPVEVVPGPSALTLALVLSGLPADRFVFEGFLPRKGRERRERLDEIARERRTVVLYESPRRVGTTLIELCDACGAERQVAVVREITKLHEDVYRGTLGEASLLGATSEPRGEHVLVVGGSAPPVASQEHVEQAVREALERGLSARDTAAEISAELGVAKRRVYELALTLRER
jgi:16S rRNA (cytidine1402-2'-O)-methyltransferase